MKIEISLNLEKLKLVSQLLYDYLKDLHFNLNDRNSKRNIAILNQVQDKLAKKIISKKATEDDFKVKLEYYEADCLELFFCANMERLSNVFEYNTIQTLAHNMNQQLA